MPFKISPAPAVTHPAVGTYIDNDALQLVEVLGVGGYGVVYRAAAVSSPDISYAVKVLQKGDRHSTATARLRKIHMREIALHQLASAHPNVVTLHRVIEDEHYTYLILDYATSNDLFSQILHSCRYLGHDELIRHVFLQLLDAVEYCHELGIYHRDLKPENILCFDRGLRVAITDFGLATTDKMSAEFRTGSIYHMSPECQGGRFAPMGSYSPMFNDIWSLGVILLNLVTGRNPFRSSSPDDPTFQCYLRNPAGFLPTVLPISHELNSIISRMLDVDWRSRMTIAEIKEAIIDVTTFYSPGVVFEGSMARCPWEASMEVDAAAASSSGGSQYAHEEKAERDSVLDDNTDVEEEEEPKELKSPSVSAVRPARPEPKSRWSSDTEDMVFYRPQSSRSMAWDDDDDHEGSASRPPSSDGTESPVAMSPSNSDSPPPSPIPITPDSGETLFGDRTKQRQHLRLDTTCAHRSFPSSTSLMYSIIDEEGSTAANSPISCTDKGTDIIEVVDRSPQDEEMISPSVWRFSEPFGQDPKAYLCKSSTCSSVSSLSTFDANASLYSEESSYWSDLLSAPYAAQLERRRKKAHALVQSQPAPPSSLLEVITDAFSSSPLSSLSSTPFSSASSFETTATNNHTSIKKATSPTRPRFPNLLLASFRRAASPRSKTPQPALRADPAGTPAPLDGTPISAIYGISAKDATLATKPPAAKEKLAPSPTPQPAQHVPERAPGALRSPRQWFLSGRKNSAPTAVPTRAAA